MTKKEFSKKLKPFLTNKVCFSEDQISIEVNDELVSDEKIVTQVFNAHYISIVVKSYGTSPSLLGDSANPLLGETTVGRIKAFLLKSHFSMGVLLQICCIFSEDLLLRTHLGDCFWIIDTYQDYPIVIAVKSSVTQNSKSKLPHATTQDINKIINSLGSKKATGLYGIPVKFIKLSANVIDSHLANIINKDIDLNCYSESAKIRPIFKKDEKTKVKNYRLLVS